MKNPYVKCARHIAWLVESLEKMAVALPSGTPVDSTLLSRAVAGRLPSGDEVAAVLKAFEGLGVLKRSGDTLVLDRAALQETDGYRKGVKEALLELNSSEANPTVLCATIPPGLDPGVETKLRADAIDLRAALMDVLASAKRRLVVVSPFWDVEAAADISEFLARRLDAGVKVSVLGRGRTAEDAGFQVLESRLSSHAGCQMLAWYEPAGATRSAAQTFHFKAVLADDGERAYLGTANLTTSGLRSRMELGVILTGNAAARLSRVVDLVLGLARPTLRKSARL